MFLRQSSLMVKNTSPFQKPYENNMDKTKSRVVAKTVQTWIDEIE